MTGIRLNFVPLEDQNTDFTIYRELVKDSSQKKSSDLYRAKLPEKDIETDWVLYDTTFKPRSGFEKIRLNIKSNAYLSEHYLFQMLRDQLHETPPKMEFSIPSNTKYKEIVFHQQQKRTGMHNIIVHPYFLKRNKKLGFLIKSRFSLNDSDQFNRLVQIESLSLDKNGKPNIFIYRDKEILLSKFLNEIFIPLVSGTKISIISQLEFIESIELDRKSYIVRNRKSCSSQFVGIKNSGPYKSIDENVRYLFAFSERTRSLGRDVYLGLTGKLFPSQFSGLEAMFGLPIRKELVDHRVLEFSETSILEFRKFLDEYCFEYSNTKIMLIVIIPKGIKGVDKAYDVYAHIKMMALEKNIYCQFLTEDTFFRKDSLKWSVSNIGLQIFSKLGGTPWLVKPAKSNCLILGLGSSHEIVDDQVKKWFAYTVCLNSSGEFRYIKPLSSSENKKGYIQELKQSLRSVLTAESVTYKSFVLHVPFKIKYEEINAIKEVVRESQLSSSCEFIVIRINTEHKYMGFSSHNTRVPHESTLVELSSNQFLMWPEGLQHGKEALQKRVSEPVFVDFIYAPNKFETKKDCLQDILNLTGANWRGFNSKSQPVSILYSRLIAKFMKEFSHLDSVKDMSIIESESFMPWFL